MMISSKNKSTPTFVKWGSYLCLFFAVLFLHACNVENDEPLIEDNYRQYEIVKGAVTPPNAETVEVVDTVTTFNFDTKEETVRIVKSNLPIHKQPEVMPIFGDCGDINDVEERYACSNQNLLTFIYSNLTYPKEAKDNGVEGVNVIQFVIGPSGQILTENFIKSIGNGTDEAIQKVLDKMKEEKGIWTAGRQDGKDVATQFTLPIKFKLEG